MVSVIFLLVCLQPLLQDILRFCIQAARSPTLQSQLRYVGIGTPGIRKSYVVGMRRIESHI